MTPRLPLRALSITLLVFPMGACSAAAGRPPVLESIAALVRGGKTLPAGPVVPDRGQVIGRVRDRAGNPLAGVSVSAWLVTKPRFPLVSDHGGQVVSSNGGSAFGGGPGPGAAAVAGLAGQPYALLQANGALGEARTDASGRFVLNVPEGQPINLEAVGGAQKALAPVGDSLSVELVLQPPGTLVGRIIPPPGQSAAGIDVYLPGTRYLVRTDAEGNYRIPDVPVAAYSLRADKDQLGAVVARDVTVQAGETREVDELRLDAGATPPPPGAALEAVVPVPEAIVPASPAEASTPPPGEAAAAPGESASPASDPPAADPLAASPPPAPTSVPDTPAPTLSPPPPAPTLSPAAPAPTLSPATPAPTPSPAATPSPAPPAPTPPPVDPVFSDTRPVPVAGRPVVGFAVYGGTPTVATDRAILQHAAATGWPAAVATAGQTVGALTVDASGSYYGDRACVRRLNGNVYTGDPIRPGTADAPSKGNATYRTIRGLASAPVHPLDILEGEATTWRIRRVQSDNSTKTMATLSAVPSGADRWVLTRNGGEPCLYIYFAGSKTWSAHRYAGGAPVTFAVAQTPGVDAMAVSGARRLVFASGGQLYEKRNADHVGTLNLTSSGIAAITPSAPKPFTRALALAFDEANRLWAVAEVEGTTRVLHLGTLP